MERAAKNYEAAREVRKSILIHGLDIYMYIEKPAYLQGKRWRADKDGAVHPSEWDKASLESMNKRMKAYFEECRLFPEMKTCQLVKLAYERGLLRLSAPLPEDFFDVTRVKPEKLKISAEVTNGVKIIRLENERVLSIDYTNALKKTLAPHLAENHKKVALDLRRVKTADGPFTSFLRELNRQMKKEKRDLILVVDEDSPDGARLLLLASFLRVNLDENLDVRTALDH